jgi:hypothetical protein
MQQVSVKHEVKHEVKQELTHDVKKEVKRETRHEVQHDVAQMKHNVEAAKPSEAASQSAQNSSSSCPGSSSSGSVDYSSVTVRGLKRILAQSTGEVVILHDANGNAYIKVDPAALLAAQVSLSPMFYPLLQSSKSRAACTVTQSFVFHALSTHALVLALLCLTFIHQIEDAAPAAKRERLEQKKPLVPQQPAPAAAPPAALANVQLDSEHIYARLCVNHDGYFRQLPNSTLVFQLRGVKEEYKSLQGTARHTPGVTLVLNLSAQHYALLDYTRSSVVCSLDGDSENQLVFAVAEAPKYDATAQDMALQLTATADSYMELATAIRNRAVAAVKTGSMVCILHFGTAGVVKFSTPFVWRSLATCKKLNAGEYKLAVTVE